MGRLKATRNILRKIHYYAVFRRPGYIELHVSQSLGPTSSLETGNLRRAFDFNQNTVRLWFIKASEFDYVASF